MALRLSDADEMIKVCDENNVRLFVVKQNRYNLPVQKLRNAIDDKKFGKNALWARPKKMFLEYVEVDGKKVPRFEYVGK